MFWDSSPVPDSIPNGSTSGFHHCLNHWPAYSLHCFLHDLCSYMTVCLRPVKVLCLPPFLSDPSSEVRNTSHSSILAWRIPWPGEPDGLLHRIAKSQTWLMWLSIAQRTLNGYTYNVLVSHRFFVCMLFGYFFVSSLQVSSPRLWYLDGHRCSRQWTDCALQEYVCEQDWCFPCLQKTG